MKKVKSIYMNIEKRKKNHSQKKVEDKRPLSYWGYSSSKKYMKIEEKEEEKS